MVREAHRKLSVRLAIWAHERNFRLLGRTISWYWSIRNGFLFHVYWPVSMRLDLWFRKRFYPRCPKHGQPLLHWQPWARQFGCPMCFMGEIERRMAVQRLKPPR